MTMTMKTTMTSSMMMWMQPKIQLCSKYERHTDHRTYADRMHHFEELAKEPPAPEIQHVGGGGGAAEGEEE